MTTTVDQARAETLAGGHYWCEDPWYSCPLSVEGCCNDAVEKACNCGYEERVKAIALAFAGVRQAAQQEERIVVLKAVAQAFRGAIKEHWNQELKLAFKDFADAFEPKALTPGGGSKEAG
jgi:hypothetical protein